MAIFSRTTRRITAPRRHVMQNIDSLDRSIFDAVATSHSPVMDSLMPKLSRTADYSVLWMGLGAGMAATRNQRLVWAAQRGLAGVAVTSLVTNQIAKRVHGRRRPFVADVPLARRAVRLPTSSSFPSGHSASAAAFAAGVAAEHPIAGMAAQGLAALVGFSRVATGAHYPSDVIVGFGIGATVSAIGAKVFPPVPVPSTKPTDPVLVEMPKRVGGEGIIVVINPKSGSGTGERVLAQVEKLLPKAEIVRLAPDDDLDEKLADAAERCEVLGVAGGDGTIRAAASLASRRDTPLAVFPAGTFNHFARSVGVGVRDTARAIETGQCTKVDVARLNDEVFLNTASAGSYPQFVQLRESLEHKIGKPLAAAVAAAGARQTVHGALRRSRVRAGRHLRGQRTLRPAGLRAAGPHADG